MGALTISDLKETAALARLNLDEGELAAMLPAFEQMLEYFSEMQKADNDSAFQECSANDPQPVDSAFRVDNPVSFSANETLLNNAGQRDGRFIVIPNILDKSNGV